MTLSIILPVYNTEKYIARAIQSCIQQSFKNLEIIIVDDCGKDQSIEIAKEFAKTDSRIKIIHNQENLKLLQTRIEGAKFATSDYLMFLDSDDYLHLQICEKITKTLLWAKNLDLLCFGMLAESQDGFKSFGYGVEMNTILSRKAFCEMILQSRKYNWNLSGKVFKREIFLKAMANVPLPRLNMAEDALIFFLTLACTSNLLVLDQNGYYYCASNTQSITRDNKIEAKITNLKDEEKVIKFLTNQLPSIQERPLFAFAKMILKDLKFYHRLRQNTLFYLKHQGFLAKLIVFLLNHSIILMRKIDRKIDRLLHKAIKWV